MRLHVHGLAAVALAAALPVDGSFLVQGIVPNQPPRPPLFRVPTPPQARADGKPDSRPAMRCPMTIVNGDSRMDPRFSRQPRRDVTFTIRRLPPSCSAR